MFDLNKTTEIKFSPMEIVLFKQNYELFVKSVVFKNIDPIDMIPVIAQRLEFDKTFNKLLSTEKAISIIKSLGHKIRTPRYIEIVE